MPVFLSVSLFIGGILLLGSSTQTKRPRSSSSGASDTSAAKESAETFFETAYHDDYAEDVQQRHDIYSIEFCVESLLSMMEEQF